MTELNRTILTLEKNLATDSENTFLMQILFFLYLKNDMRANAEKVLVDIAKLTDDFVLSSFLFGFYYMFIGDTNNLQLVALNYNNRFKTDFSGESLVRFLINHKYPLPLLDNDIFGVKSNDSSISKADLSELINSDFNGNLSENELTLNDVVGMDDIKNRLKVRITVFIQNDDFKNYYKRKFGGGLILYGPPGCGKTYVAKALAGELKYNFIEIKLGDILGSYLSIDSGKNYFERFSIMRPCVLFIDELDAVTPKRYNISTMGGKAAISRFLIDLDGINSNREGLFILGSTNRVWDIDEAFKRPGRFDEVIFVPPPSADDREVLIANKLKDIPNSVTNVSKIAKATNNYSHADLCFLIDIAVENAIDRSAHSRTLEPVNNEDLAKALLSIEPSTIEWFNSARSFAVFSENSRIYSSLKSYMKQNKLA